MTTHCKTRRRRAITIVELTLVLGLAALVVMLALRAFSMAQSNSQYHATLTVVGQLRAAVSQSLSTLNYVDLPGSLQDVLPRSVLSASGRGASPGGGLIDLQPFGLGGASANSFRIIVTSLSPELCRRLMTTDMGKSTVAWFVDATNAIAVPAEPNFYAATPPSSDNVDPLCNAGAAVSAGWIFQ